MGHKRLKGTLNNKISAGTADTHSDIYSFVLEQLCTIGSDVKRLALVPLYICLFYIKVVDHLPIPLNPASQSGLTMLHAVGLNPECVPRYQFELA